MKNLPLLLILIVFIYGCSKNDSTQTKPKPVQKTWISGKWNLIHHVDTLMYLNGETVIHNEVTPNELNFIDTNKVTQTITGSMVYKYSLKTMKIDLSHDNAYWVYTIIKISDTDMKLYMIYSSGGGMRPYDENWISWTDEYVKE